MTRADLRRLAPGARDSYLDAFARVDLLEAAGMLARPLRLAHFMAQVCHETGGLTILVESLHYRAARLMQVWPSRFPTIEAAAPYAGNPRALANHVYGGRMGNVDPDDGWRYIGRGLLQLTGRDAYARVGRALGLDLIGHPYLAASAEHALAVGLEVWRWKDCDGPADADDIVRVTQRINGGCIGLADRRAWLARAKAALEVMP